MFIDWLRLSQTFDHDLPTVCDVYSLTIDANTHEILSTKQPKFQHRGSHCSSITINIQGRKLTVDGNPSRINRLDNLFGFTTIQQCVNVYNALLAEYGLPGFTRCTTVQQCQVKGMRGKFDQALIADGATIERIDLTTNAALGKDNVLAFLRGVSTQSIGHSVGFLYPNGRTCVWTPEGNGEGGRLQYRKLYDKAFEMASKKGVLAKVKRLYGETSLEYAHVQRVHKFCIDNGICRFEQELKSELLKRKGLSFWGLFDEGQFAQLHDEFLKVDDRLKVTAMDIVTIAQQLIDEGVVTSTYAANITAMYAINWANGQAFDFDKSQTKTHRARLRRIGLDIARPYDNTRSATVIVREAREVTKTFDIQPPAWYRMPEARQLRLVA
ncbi:phage/plasmid replication protein [Pseudomonas sp. TMP9]|uniref:phage/plasmid replication domain-containing protein n=1 Tax=Pseudomonas sp. TMP9 TaxID=3133144 RepID=UPI0030CFDAC1